MAGIAFLKGASSEGKQQAAEKHFYIYLFAKNQKQLDQKCWPTILICSFLSPPFSYNLQGAAGIQSSNCTFWRNHSQELES